MPEDYHEKSNAKSEKPEGTKEERLIQKAVISGEVIHKKKGLGRKFKELFVGADAKSVVVYVFTEVLVPAARNMIVDASEAGIRRMMYGETSSRRRGVGSLGGGSRISYNSPVDRDRPPGGFRFGGPTRPYTGQPVRSNKEEFILENRADADLVLERMSDIIDQCGVVSLADLNELLGLPMSYTDNKWGWSFLTGSVIQQVREGFLLNLPPMEPIG